MLALAAESQTESQTLNASDQAPQCGGAGAVPARKIVHAILDHYATHKHPKVKLWLADHLRWVIQAVEGSPCPAKGGAHRVTPARMTAHDPKRPAG